MSFEHEHEAYIQSHLSRRTGERKDRLARGHRHAEKLFLQNIWWELKGNFACLHPEYEILDWRGRPYFADFAFIPNKFMRILLEIKGFNSHIRDMDQTKFCNENKRELYLQAIGYRIVSFAYDDIEQRPEQIISLVRLFLSQFEAEQKDTNWRVLAEKETLRLALSSSRPLRPKDVEDHFRMNHRTAVKLLHNLCEKGMMSSTRRGAGVRARSYEVKRDYWM